MFANGSLGSEGGGGRRDGAREIGAMFLDLSKSWGVRELNTRVHFPQCAVL